MPQPRVPTAVLEMRGSFKRHAERKKKRQYEPVVEEPIGGPPANFTEKELETWNELMRLAPGGVLTSADQWSVEVAVKLMAKVREDRANSADIGQLITLLGRFGMTPADRSKVKVSIPVKKPGNPFTKIG
jgi:hypothetical protein